MSREERWLARQARERPDQPAVVFGGCTTSFAQLEDRALGLAAGLRGAGVGRGDRVAVLHESHPFIVDLVHALILLEAVLVPLHTRLTPGELRGQVEDAEPRLLIHGHGFEPVAADLRRTLPGLPLLAADAVPALADEPAPLSSRPRLDTDQAVLFTSGTSGRPKGVRLSLSNHLASAAGSAARLGSRPGDRWLACLPLHHIGGLAIVLRCAIDGMTLVLHRCFDARAVVEALRHHRIQAVSLVPTMLERVLDAAGNEPFPGSLRFVLLGGGPIPPALLDRARRRGVPVAPTYGLSEAASQVATLSPGDRNAPPGTVGRPLPGVEIRVVDDQDREVPAGTPGEVQVRGAQVMSGYLNLPDQTARAIRDGWLRTGDIGRLGADGYLFVLDRRTDLIVSGGENVVPAEVECALRAHPGVVDAAVVGGADTIWGQVVHAFIVPAPGRAPSREEILAHCRSRLAGFKQPRAVHFVSRLPRDPAGKLRRKDVG